MPTWCFCFGHVYLRIIESYNNLGLKRLIISLSAIISLTLASPPLYHVPKCHNYTSFKYLQGWNSTTSLGSLFLIVLESIIFMLKIKLQFILIRKTKFPHLCELIFLVKLRPWYKLFNSFLVVQNKACHSDTSDYASNSLNLQNKRKQKCLHYWPGLEEPGNLLTNKGSFLRNTPASVKTEKETLCEINTGNQVWNQYRKSVQESLILDTPSFCVFGHKMAEVRE